MVTELVTMQLARDTAANWTAGDWTLADGEFAIETDTGSIKVGDGVTAWTNLDYVNQPGSQSFPAAPRVNQRIYRSDLNIEFYWDGTRWLSVHLYSFQLGFPQNDSASTADELVGFLPVPYKNEFGIYLTTVDFIGLKSASGQWNILFGWYNTNSINTLVTSTFTQTSGQVNKTSTLNSVLTTSADMVGAFMDEISGSGTFFGAVIAHYRLIG